jgi:hypothetical protein
MNKKLEESNKINSNDWKTWRMKFYFCLIFIEEIININPNLKNNYASENIFNEIFDAEIDWNQTTNKNQQSFLNIFPSKIHIIKKCIQKVDQIEIQDSKIHKIIKKCIRKVDQIEIKDSNFVNDLYNAKLSNKTRTKIISIFFNEYTKWRNILPNNINMITPKFSNISRVYDEELKKESSQKIKEIEDHEVEKICTKLEEMFPEG